MSFDQIGNRADFQAMLPGEGDQVGQTGHGAVIIHDLTDYTGGFAITETRQINRCAVSWKHRSQAASAVSSV